MAPVTDVERFLQFSDAIGLRLEPFQRMIVEESFSPRRELLVSIGRGNGKTTLIAALGLFDLLSHPEAKIYVAAASRGQAAILFDEAAKMARKDPYIRKQVRPTQRDLKTEAGGKLAIIAADAEKQLGLIPSRVIVDELGSHKNDELYHTLRSSMHKVDDSKMTVISTAAISGEGPLWDLRERCMNQPEIRRDGVLTIAKGEHLAMLEWSLPTDWPLDRAIEANPLKRVTAEKIEELRQSMHETAFRRFHANQWVNASTDPWFPDGVWQACTTGRRLQPGTEVTLGFDGSFSADSTALVACSTEEKHLELIQLWEKPEERDWRVPIQEVEDAIRAACKRFDVREVTADAYRWARSLELLRDEGLPVEEYPQTPQRMVPATTRLYEAVTNKQVTHDGNPDLARHVGNAVLKVGRNGGHLSKASKTSPRRIDAAVAAVMAHDRACQQPARMIPLVAFR